MEILILLCLISVALNIAIYPLCKITIREEDAIGIAEGKMKMKSELTHFPKACWIMSAVMMIIAASLHNDYGSVVMLLFLQCLVVFFLCLIAAFRRDRYYTIDDERLSYVKHGILEWSHSWDEIDHARKRIISTGKSFIILYDIETKEGVKHRSLPSTLGRDLKEHVRIDNRLKPGLICLIIILVFVISVLIVLAKLNR